MEIVRLEDNLEYVILDTINIDNIDYVYLALVTDKEQKSVCIRKIINNGDDLSTLDSEIEFRKALDIYVQKYKSVINVA